MGQPKEDSPYKYRSVEKKVKTREDTIREVERSMGARLTESTLSKEQREAFDTISHWYERDSTAQQVLTLGGYAGTGKSTLVSVLAGKYADESVIFTSFTGKATSVLRSKLFEANVPGCHDVKTLHSLMYIPIVDKETGRVRGWRRREHLDHDLIIVDEASMLDEQMFNDLKAYNIPILAVGDHGQLPPVFGTFNLMEKPQLRLEKIHRQAEDSPILALADFVRRVGQIPRFDNTMELQLIPQRHTEAVFDSLFQTPGLRQSDVGLLCYSNRQRVEFNEQARRARWKGRFSESPIVGDQLICLRNEDGTIFNGMRGELTRCVDSTVLHYDGAVLFEDDEVEVEGPICKAQFGLTRTIKDFDDYHHLTDFRVKSWGAVGLLFDYGYALTAHKAQGSQFEHVIVSASDVPNRLSLDEKRRWLYTAFTRASRYLCILQ